MPADFDGSVGQIAIDIEKTRDIRPDKVNDALQLLIGHSPLVKRYLTVWDTHQDGLTQPPLERESNNSIPTGFPTIPCPPAERAIPRLTSRSWSYLQEPIE